MHILFSVLCPLRPLPSSTALTPIVTVIPGSSHDTLMCQSVLSLTHTRGGQGAGETFTVPVKNNTAEFAVDKSVQQKSDLCLEQAACDWHQLALNWGQLTAAQIESL